MTRVIYDYQAFAMQQTGGVSRYFAQLIQTLQRHPELAVEPLLEVSFAANRYLRDELNIDSKVRAGEFFHRYQGRGQGKLQAIGNIANKHAAFRLLLQQPNALYHPSYFDPWFLAMQKQQKRLSSQRLMVVTVHDMIHELLPDQVADPHTTDNKRLMMQRADALVAVSQTTQADIIKLYPELAEKITVIHHGATLTDDIPTGTFHHDTPYLLFVGNRWSYKNFSSVAHACADIFADYPDLSLLCAGGGPFTATEMQLLHSLNIAHRTVQCSPDDSTLKALYQGAELFVFPSQYEGFGMPVLEAMGNGAPCVLSSSSSLPEVGADAALYFDAQGENGGAAELATQCKRILGSSETRAQLAAAGHKRAAQFSWHKCATQHANLYTNLYHKHHG
ncbi:MAG: glycosyltransferase family 4 protein [Coriobacteriia bacterium]|nr:glycosyltransferase family 4 protein [Coriobacteriia bacterium]